MLQKNFPMKVDIINNDKINLSNHKIPIITYLPTQIFNNTDNTLSDTINTVKFSITITTTQSYSYDASLEEGLELSVEVGDIFGIMDIGRDLTFKATETQTWSKSEESSNLYENSEEVSTPKGKCLVSTAHYTSNHATMKYTSTALVMPDRKCSWRLWTTRN